MRWYDLSPNQLHNSWSNEAKRSNQRPLRRQKQRWCAGGVVTKDRRTKSCATCFVLLETIQHVSILSAPPRLLLLAILFRRCGLHRKALKTTSLWCHKGVARWPPRRWRPPLQAVLGKTLLSFIPYLMVGKVQQSSKVNRFSKAAANPGLNMWFFQRTLSTHTRKTLLLLLHACSAHCQAATCVASTQHLPMQSGQMNEMTDIESDLVFQRVPVS